jgi:hypothetical protein
MGSFKEIGDFLRDAKGTIKEIQCKADDIRGSSIAKRSSAATLQFPVIMSRSINVDTASSIVKALERQYAIFVQMVISLNPVINWEEDDIPGFINKLHQNNPTPIDMIESCINVYSDEALGLTMFTSINEGCNGEVLRSNKEQMFNIEDQLNPYKLNDLYKPEQITLAAAESALDYFCKKNEILTEANGRGRNLNRAAMASRANRNNNIPNPNTTAASANNGTVNPTNTTNANGNNNLHADEFDNALAVINTGIRRQQQIDNDEQNNINNAISIMKHADDMESRKIQTQLSINDTIYKRQKDKKDEEMAKARFKLELDKANAEHRAKAIVKLSDNDIKKCNELVPTTLSVTLQQMSGNNFGGSVNFILGIKGLMHPVNSDEMVSNLLDGYKAGNKFFNFLRWTSGEITFLKDLLFNIDGIKEDVIKKHSKNSHWWTTLKRNRTIARVRNIYGKNKILPNATIACSMEEIMEIKDVYNVDFMDPRNIKKLMDRYFLLGFVIVDESQELCYFMFDGENEPHALSFKGLEKENNNKNDFKDIYKMINSGRL